MDKLLLLGVGNVALNVAKFVKHPCTVFGTTRKASKLEQLESLSISPILLSSDREIPTKAVMNADVLVSFPPDPDSDRALSTACAYARRIIYISSTGVYGKLGGAIDENSPVDADDPVASKRLAAEETWRSAGALVLRCPGLYGLESGWHLRIKNGTAKIPGEGKNVGSRIHLADLARLVIACFEANLKSSIYVVGDLEPASHFDTISYVCENMKVALPPSAPFDDVSPTLRGNRMIDASKLYSELGFKLDYPNYRLGYDAILREFGIY